MNNKVNAIIFDLDGTLSDCTERRPFVQSKPKDFPSFYYNIPSDPPNKWCQEILYAMKDKYISLFVSGRPEKLIMGMNEHPLRTWTEDWLLKHTPYHLDYIRKHLFMRSTGDVREDYIIKRELYEAHIKDHFNILFAIDDRRQVVDEWRRLGITCLQRADGSF